MKGKSAIIKVNIDMLPVTRNTLTIENFMVIDDNLDVCDEDMVAARDLISQVKFPFKLMFTAIFFCIKGNANLKINLTDYALHEREIIIIRPGAIINELDYSDDAKFIRFTFAEDTIFHDNHDRCLKIIQQNLLHPMIIRFNSNDDVEKVIGGYMVIRKVIQLDNFPYAKEVIEGFAKIGTASLAQWIRTRDEEKPASQKSREEMIFTRFLKEVQENCSTHRRVNYYASLFCLSPKYFAKIIYDVSGKHAGDWIRDYVILEAKAMLRTGKYTVQQVSAALHFPNSSFFGKYFKAATGISPGQYISEY